MNAGKSTLLLQTAFNFRERGLVPLLFIPNISKKLIKLKNILSRIGIQETVVSVTSNFNFYNYIIIRLVNKERISCILVDEVHFLKKKHIFSLLKIVDVLNIPVFTYGLRSDFIGNSFEGSLYLLLLADKLVEVDAVCFCGNDAVMTIRVDKQQKRVFRGKQVMIGGNELYTPVCRRYFFTGKH